MSTGQPTAINPITKESIFSRYIDLSLPTKKQTIRAVETIVVAFVAGAVYSWLNSPNPFSKDAIIGAGTAGVAAVYSIVKIFVTNL